MFPLFRLRDFKVRKLTSDVEKHQLTSGIPCIKHGCVECCIETMMPLLDSDIKRIVKLGYKLDDFAVKTGDGWRLKNISGGCFFLSNNGCRIYPQRPEGCRLYPLIYDENLRKPMIDSLCPHGHEFEVQESGIKKLKTLLEKLERERMNRYSL